MTDTPPPADDALRATAAAAVMVPFLPCGDIDVIADFWTGLGLTVTYRQRRPNPYVALELGRIALHYYGMPRWDPEASHSTCVVGVPDTTPLYERFAAGLRERFGRLPVDGVPRITRPRRRANNAGLTGFSLIDPAGNWVRFSRLPPPDAGPVAPDGDVTVWVTEEGAGPLARALDAAVVQADSHGEPAQARKALTGALRRATDQDRRAAEDGATVAPTPVAELARALAYLVELCVRTGDEQAARDAFARLAALAETGGPAVDPAVAAAVDDAVAEARAVLPPG